MSATGTRPVRRCLAFLAGGLASLALAGPASAIPTWAVQNSPNPAGADASRFLGVSCSSPRACMAVGQFGPAPLSGAALAERWNGSAWSIVPVPSPAGAQQSALAGVSCTSASACVAVGEYAGSDHIGRAYAAHWNGSAWSVASIPTSAGSRSSQLVAVSCVRATACTAVGTDLQDVGRFGKPVALFVRWDGTRWTSQPSPDLGTNDLIVKAVSCPRLLACTVVGAYGSPRASGGEVPLAERWNGRRWKVQAVPDPPGAIYTWLQGVACPRKRACLAVGFTSSAAATVNYAARWNGRHWRRQTVPAPAVGPSQLFGLSCSGPGACTAIGERLSSPTGYGFPLPVRWNGRRWRIQPAPAPAGAQFASTTAIACPTRPICVATGYWGRSTGPQMTLVLRR